MDKLTSQIPAARCSDAEKQLILKAVEKKGVRITEWIRRNLIRDAKKEIAK